MSYSFPSAHDSDDFSSGLPCTSFPPRSPTKAFQFPRIQSPYPPEVGVSPTELIGKVLVRVQRSSMHPNVTLHFADHTTFQIRVDGYDPKHRGIPKVLEMRSSVFEHPGDVELTISHAAAVTMEDFALERGEQESRWRQRHNAIALKFEGESEWHCVWATLAEYDEHDESRCIFRKFTDVYLDALHRPARPVKTSRARKPSSQCWSALTRSTQKPVRRRPWDYPEPRTHGIYSPVLEDYRRTLDAVVPVVVVAAIVAHIFMYS